MLARSHLVRALTVTTLATGFLTTASLVVPTATAHQPVQGSPLSAETELPPFRTLPGATLSPAWVLPLERYRVTATFGATSGPWAAGHTGLDLAAPVDTEVRAVAAGVLTHASYDGAYGNKAVLRLDDGTEVWFCHLGDFAVAVGDRVVAGQAVGWVGTTGNITGPHLHLEIRPDGGAPVPPAQALRDQGLSL